MTAYTTSSGLASIRQVANEKEADGDRATADLIRGLCDMIERYDQQVTIIQTELKSIARYHPLR